MAILPIRTLDVAKNWPYLPELDDLWSMFHWSVMLASLHCELQILLSFIKEIWIKHLVTQEV